MPQAPNACLIQCKICNLLRKKGVEDSFLLRGNMFQEPFSHFRRTPFSDYSFDVFFTSISMPIYPKILSKWTSGKHQQSQKSTKNHSLNLAWKSCLQKGTLKCENRFALQRFSSIFKVPRHPKKHPKLDPKWKLKL